jgi:hypothetical protein
VKLRSVGVSRARASASLVVLVTAEVESDVIRRFDEKARSMQRMQLQKRGTVGTAGWWRRGPAPETQ